MNGMEFDIIKSLVENKKYSAITEYSRIVNPNREDIIVTEYAGSDVSVYKDDNGNVRLLCPKTMDVITEGHVAQAISNGTIFDDADDVDNNATMIERTTLPYEAMINSGKPTPKHLKPMIAIIIGKMDNEGSCAVSDADRTNGVNFIKDLCCKDDAPHHKVVHVVGHWIGKSPQDFYTPEMGKSITQLDKEVDDIKCTNPEDCISDDDCCESYANYDMDKIESGESTTDDNDDNDEDNSDYDTMDEDENEDSEDEDLSDDNDDNDGSDDEDDDSSTDNDDNSDLGSDDDNDDEDFDVEDDIPDVDDDNDSETEEVDECGDDCNKVTEFFNVKSSDNIYQESKQTHFRRTLKKFDYDPKTDTIITDIDMPNKKEKMRVKLSIDDDIAKQYPPGCVTNLIIRDKEGNITGIDETKYEIHILRKVLKQKEWKAAFMLKHEEGHVAFDHVNLVSGKDPISPSYNKEKSDEENYKVKKFLKDEKVHNKLNDHDRHKMEYVADKYAAEHTSKMSAVKGLKSMYDTGKDSLLKLYGLYDDYKAAKKRISLLKKKINKVSESDIKLVHNRLDILNKKINECNDAMMNKRTEMSKTMKKNDVSEFADFYETPEGSSFKKELDKQRDKYNKLKQERDKIKNNDPEYLLDKAEEELEDANDLIKQMELGCKTRQKFIQKYVKESFDISDISQFDKYCSILEQYEGTPSTTPHELYTNKPIQNNDVDPTMNYTHANKMMEETGDVAVGTDVSSTNGSINTMKMPMSEQTKNMLNTKVKQECGDDNCVKQECGDKDPLKQECGDKENIEQEGFFSKKPKKLKPIPRDIVPYITVSMNDIHDANDQAMLSGYTCSKIELVDFYITCIDTQDARYIVPHNRQYLETMKRDLERLLTEILRIRPINRSDQIWRVNYPT